MSSDGFFYAGLAGGRQNRIDKLNANLDEWQAYAAQLEDLVEQLRQSRLFWFNTAVNEGASAQVLGDVFKEVTGHRARDYFGEKALDRRHEDLKKTERQSKLRDWDPKL